MEVQQKSREVMEASVSAVIAKVFASAKLEGITGYAGPMTHERLVEFCRLMQECCAWCRSAIAAAPDAAAADALWSGWGFMALLWPRQHRLPHFSPVEVFGEGGKLLHDIVERRATPP